ncbi:protein of unknown function [Candidatus Promineifilum breve]|uniref:Uncharacterized protein n=1 Tax=Candidatus Promineifilum breve TaxID=1806508 RepID=A0A160T149_9CHLR|nr:protein of unknown function [Candidatus Promineifilum breve]
MTRCVVTRGQHLATLSSFIVYNVTQEGKADVASQIPRSPQSRTEPSCLPPGGRIRNRAGARFNRRCGPHCL